MTDMRFNPVSTHGEGRVYLWLLPSHIQLRQENSLQRNLTGHWLCLSQFPMCVADSSNGSLTCCLLLSSPYSFTTTTTPPLHPSGRSWINPTWNWVSLPESRGVTHGAVSLLCRGPGLEYPSYRPLSGTTAIQIRHKVWLLTPAVVNDNAEIQYY